MTKKEFTNRMEREKINLGEYIVVIDSLTDEQFVIGCYQQNNMWKIYKTKVSLCGVAFLVVAYHLSTID